uniref:Uncharacterized protein n=1 Tax=Brassica oleracea var. oleracea TaxID=109376 RepID=A0A0D3B3L9_BRAOL
MISTNFISDILSLILTKNVFSNLFCTLVYDLKSNYAKTLSRNDVKNIVNTGFYTLGDSFCVFVTAGAKGKFFGEFDISGFCETQKGARKKQKVRYISIDIITDLLEAIREPSVAANKYSKQKVYSDLLCLYI